MKRTKLTKVMSIVFALTLMLGSFTTAVFADEDVDLGTLKSNAEGALSDAKEALQEITGGTDETTGVTATGSNEKAELALEDAAGAIESFLDAGVITEKSLGDLKDAIDGAADAVNDVIKSANKAVESAETAVAAANEAAAAAEKAKAAADAALEAAKTAEAEYQAMLQEAVYNDADYMDIAEAEQARIDAWNVYVDAQNIADDESEEAMKAAVAGEKAIGEAISAVNSAQEAVKTALNAWKAAEAAVQALKGEISNQELKDLLDARDAARDAAQDACQKARETMVAATEIMVIAQEVKGIADTAVSYTEALKVNLNANADVSEIIAALGDANQMIEDYVWEFSVTDMDKNKVTYDTGGRTFKWFYLGDLAKGAKSVELVTVGANGEAGYYKLSYKANENDQHWGPYAWYLNSKFKYSDVIKEANQGGNNHGAMVLYFRIDGAYYEVTFATCACDGNNGPLDFNIGEYSTIDGGITKKIALALIEADNGPELNIPELILSRLEAVGGLELPEGIEEIPPTPDKDPTPPVPDPNFNRRTNSGGTGNNTLIGDPEVPLANLPETVIFDEEIPLADIPQTGAETGTFSLAMLGLSLMALIGMAIVGKRKDDPTYI